MHSPPLVFIVAIITLESVLLFAAPRWMTWLAFIPLAIERRIPVATLPPIRMDRRDLDGAVLLPSEDGRSFALRRAYQLIRRHHFLVHITMRLEGNEVVLRAKQAIVPLTLPLVALGVGLDPGDTVAGRPPASCSCS